MKETIVCGICEPKNSDTTQSIWEVNDEDVSEVIECVDESQSENSDLILETDVKSFNCTICEYEAMTKHDLKYHEDEKHNWCWVCDKYFETKREFKVHHWD